MRKAFFYGTYFLSPMIMIRVLYLNSPLKYSSWSMFIPMMVGVMAYNWFVWQFILSARPKFLDRWIGFDSIYKVHGRMAVISIGLALSHQWIFEEIYGQSLMTFMGSAGLNIFALVTLVSAVVYTRKYWGVMKPFQWIGNQMGKMKVFKYESMKTFHNFSFVGLIFVQIHVMMTSSAKGNIWIANMYTLYFITAVLFYTYHKLLKPWISRENAWKVSGVHTLSKTAREIELKPLYRHFRHKPGQFGFFRIKVAGLEEVHPFSFTSSSREKGEVSLAIKNLGDFTGEMDLIKTGDQVSIEGPYGSFSYLNYEEDGELVFIAGGIGITPFISMLRHLAETRPERQVTLIYGIRSEDEFLFKEELARLTQVLSHTKVIPVYSQTMSGQGEKGYIDKDLIKRNIDLDYRTLRGKGFYICGPSKMMTGVLKALKSLGIDKEHIHYEAFAM